MPVGKVQLHFIWQKNMVAKVVGIDISEELIQEAKDSSNTLLDFKDLEIDYVIMICGNEYNTCPIYLGGKKYFKKQNLVFS